jgi:hypothetical protein
MVTPDKWCCMLTLVLLFHFTCPCHHPSNPTHPVIFCHSAPTTPTPTTPLGRLSSFHIARPEEFPLQELVAVSSLDTAQAEALAACLTQELALVQGPPGTGEWLCAQGRGELWW